MKKFLTKWVTVVAIGLISTLIVMSITANAESEKEKDQKLNYLYIEEGTQEVGEEQNIVISWGEADSSVQNIDLVVEDENGEQTILQPQERVDELFLYQNTFSQGVYHVLKLVVENDENTMAFTMEEFGIDAYFGVGETVDEDEKSDYITVENAGTEDESEEIAEDAVINIDESGEVVSNSDITDVLSAQETSSVSNAKMARTANTAKKANIVVVLDPGHDSKHAGASGNGVKEEVATLKIAKYCKEELEQYGGVTVYLTREGADCPYPSSSNNIVDIQKRVEWAKTKGATAFVSIHLNSSTSTGAKGAEVYCSKNSTEGKNLAQKIQNELVALGLNDRKIKTNDEYAVIRNSTKQGFPGLIIEHAFLTNSSDASKYLKSDASLKKLGVADATGIAEYYGLSRGQWVYTSGYWKWKDGNGNYVKNAWKYIKDVWYHFDASGNMQTGWQTIDGKKYYMNSSGAMLTGWQFIGKNWYYLNSSGAMQTGWQKISNKWYYMNGSGVMQAGWLKLGASKFYLSSSGAMVIGLQSINGQKYYFNSDGYMQTGWQTINGKKYFFNKTTGAMENKNTPGWHKENQKWYYYDANGTMVTGWAFVSGKWYYMNTSGIMQTGWQKIKSKWYYMNSSGAMLTGWQKIKNKWYYMNSSGAMLTGWQKIKNKWYYMESSGAWNANPAGKPPTSTVKPTEKPPVNDAENESVYYDISGESSVTVDQLVEYYQSKKKAYPSEVLGLGGASTIREFCEIYYEECEIEGIKAEVAFVQAMHETGYLQFGGSVKIEQFNFAGLGAVGGDASGAAFQDVREGIRAHVQHLKCWANTEPLVNDCVDPRWGEWMRGKAPYVEWLSKSSNPSGYGWATDENYVTKILTGIAELKK